MPRRTSPARAHVYKFIYVYVHIYNFGPLLGSPSTPAYPVSLHGWSLAIRALSRASRPGRCMYAYKYISVRLYTMYGV